MPQTHLTNFWIGYTLVLMLNRFLDYLMEPTKAPRKMTGADVGRLVDRYGLHVVTQYLLEAK